MLVYGDAHDDAPLGVLVSNLRARCDAALDAAERCRSAPLRELLVLAGQLEQAIADAAERDGGGRWPLAPAHAATAGAAAAFHAAWAACASDGPSPGGARRGREAIERSLREMGGALAGLREDDARVVRLRVPEGFAFYGLFPEQYAGAARRWLTGRPPARALVVGLRSIGTPLGALVGAALAASGWQVRTVSVRPTGHPFDRRASLSREDTAHADIGIVVDEGPGLSGSSMAAAALALVEAGLDPSQLVLFPGHGGEPGAAASEATRALFRRLERCVLAPGELLVDGQRLEGALASGLEELLPAERVDSITDLGGGLWRNVLYGSAEAWPPAFASFVRPQYLAALRGGARVLLRFEGFAGAAALAETTAGAAAERQRARAAQRLGPSPLGVVHGFLATSWIEGTPIDPGSARRDRALLERLGHSLSRSRGEPLDRAEQEAALARLGEMLRVNAEEALGARASARVRARLDDAKRGTRGEPLPSASGSSLAPEAWVRDTEGHLWSIGSTNRDHTLVGRQFIAWDIAAALVEWRLPPRAASALLAAFRAAGGPAIRGPVLAFYRAAYAALRSGMCMICAQASAHDPAEQARLSRAAGFYLVALAKALGFRRATRSRPDSSRVITSAPPVPKRR